MDISFLKIFRKNTLKVMCDFFRRFFYVESYLTGVRHHLCKKRIFRIIVFRIIETGPVWNEAYQAASDSSRLTSVKNIINDYSSKVLIHLFKVISIDLTPYEVHESSKQNEKKEYLLLKDPKIEDQFLES
ncbi:hypothetical protein BpHYR1_042485 [Brachionus plicatilis]|uniref:Uncharacterized protein n=1 Tax=Brachionus plicatilis TaxID=10195 RepID=A0A3M7SX10_BRAPC|nr:hypothetical protein BpHYR1_042485 [Brachionus plicatilis]